MLVAACVCCTLPLQLDTANIATFHKFKSDAENDPTGLKARVQRVTSEIAGVCVGGCLFKKSPRKAKGAHQFVTSA
jgi:hypothetical protein